ncbi:MAG: immunoglobulin domain-containing protein [Limisphaerales bacterium]
MLTQLVRSAHALFWMFALSLFTAPMACSQAPGAHSATLTNDVFIGGNFLELGINSGGSFGSKGGVRPAGFFGTTRRQDIGMSTDLDGFGVGTVQSFDYFLPGTPYVAWAAGYKIAGAPTTGLNSRSGSDGITPVAVVNTSSGTNLSATTTGILGGNLQIVQVISFGVDKTFYMMQIGLTNVGAVSLNNVRYMWDVDPDNTVDLGGSFTTVNTITNTFAAGDGKAVVQARSTGSATSADLVLYTIDPRGVVFRGGPLGAAASAIYDANRWDVPLAKGNTATDDNSIAMTADVGTLAPGQGTIFTFYIGLGADVLTDIETEVPPPTVQTPTISVQPHSFRVLPGTNVTFSVGLTTNTNAPGPFTYQWRRYGINIPGANTSTLSLSNTLTLTNVQTNNTGNYTVVIGNAFGTVTSDVATLEVLTPPVITTQPLGSTNLVGDPLSFTVEATGSTNLFYQWRFNGTNVGDALTNTFTIDSVSVTNAGNYSVIISNLAGVIISSNALLIVHSAPVITSPPAARVVNAAGSVSFSVTVLGDTPLTYQWQLNGTNLAGANGTTYVLGAATPSHEGLYSVVVGNALGSTTSSPARLTVLPVSVVVPWATSGGGDGSDVGNGIAVDAAGNSYVAGYFTSTATFGTNTLVSAGNTDTFITKQDSNGQLLWARRAGGPGYDAARGIAVDATGNCYVTGAYEGEATFGGTTLTNTSPTSYSDVFLAKYDSAGGLVWARSTGVEFADDEGAAVAVDGAGNVLVTGRSVLDTFAGAALTNSGRVFVAKYTGAGVEVWARKAGSYSGGNLDAGTGIAADSVGNVFVSGVFYSPVAAFGADTLTNRGNSDMFLAKFDAVGTLQWVRQAGGAGEDSANGVAVAADGSAYLAGATFGTAAFSGTNVASLAGAASDAFIAKYAGNGGVLWVRQMGGSGLSAAHGVAVDAAGTVHVTGYFSGGATFGTNTLGGISGSYDAFLTRLDANGVFAFAQQAGGPDLSGDFGLGVGADAAGNSYIAGYFSGTSSAGGSPLPSRGAEDVLVARFNQFTGGGTPQLGLQRIGGQFRMRWPLASSGYILQSTTNLLAPVWQDETNALTLNGSELETDVTPGNQVRFFRLRRP